MDVLCTDKTGTLTMDRVILEKHCDVVLKEDDGVLALAYMNSHFQTGLKNVLDRAILAASPRPTQHASIPEYAKVDEIPFDFQRRIMSVVVRTPEGKDRLISKGAPEAIFTRCKQFELDGELFPMDHSSSTILRRNTTSSAPTASASWPSPARTATRNARHVLRKDDERDLILNGYVAFLDPPKETAAPAIAALAAPRRRGQGRHGRQRAGRPQDLQGGRAATGPSCCSAARSRG